MTISTPSGAVPPAGARSRTVPSDRGLSAFLLVAFGWSWGTWWLGPFVADAGDPGVLMTLVIVGGFGPAIAAVGVSVVTGGGAEIARLLRRFDPRRHGGVRPYLWAVIVFAALLLTVPAAAALGASVDADGLAGAFVSLPGMILLVAFAGGGNEELGWRGFVLPRLQQALSPLAASVVLGLIWAIWHAPSGLFPARRSRTCRSPSTPCW